MECLQYSGSRIRKLHRGSHVLNLVISGMPSILITALGQFITPLESFKPCYKWNAFNTDNIKKYYDDLVDSFKPCYKWNAFNTKKIDLLIKITMSFKPCYKWNAFNTIFMKLIWLYLKLGFKPCYKWNAFNTGLEFITFWDVSSCFKPCYKWNAFNTIIYLISNICFFRVLNLVISGMPSILIIIVSSENSFNNLF